MSIAGANIFEESTTEGVGQTTVNHPDIDTDPGSSPPDHVHIDYDLAHQACLAEIASLFEDIQADLRIITDRADDRAKGVYQRNADTIANNPANIAAAAATFINMKESGTLDLVNAEIGNPTNLGNTSAANYNALANTTPTRTATETRTQSQSPGYGASTAIVGKDGKSYFENTVPLDQLTLVPGTADGNVIYTMTGSRTLPLQSQLFNILKTAASTAGVNVSIMSGGQVPVNEGGDPELKNRAGSNRFDKGYAAELRLTDSKDIELSTLVPEQLVVMLKFAEACRDAGVTAIGMGNGYQNNLGIHVDIAWKGQTAGIISGILPLRYWGGINGKTPPLYLQELMTPRDNV
jgi:hypothetical protein